MSEVIARSKAKCRKCKARVCTIKLQPSKNLHVIDVEPVAYGGIKIINPGILGDKKSPVVGVFVGRSSQGVQYRSHRCPTT